jgi:hypothetical protein
MDGDGLPDEWEMRGWGTDPTKVDSDGDGVGDCKEAADINGDTVANFPTDTINTAKAAFIDGFGRNGTFDLNKDGAVNFPGDAIESARRTLAVVACL